MIWPLTVSFIMGLWCQHYIASYLSLWKLGYCLLLLVGLESYFAYQKKITLAYKIFFPLCFVVGVTLMTSALAIASDDISHFSGERIVRGEVMDLPQERQIEDDLVERQYWCRVQAVAGKDHWQKASGGLRLFIKQKAGEPVFSNGDIVIAKGKILLPHGYQNPGRSDVQITLKSEGITATLLAKSLQGEKKGLNRLTVLLEKLRKQITDKLNEAIAPGDAALLTAMMFGGYAGISSAVIDDFSTTGIIHILSVSGSHIALIGGAVILICSFCHIRRKITVWICAFLIFFYALLAGFCAPVLRSLLMALAGLGAILAGREQDSSQAFALTALLLLIYEPLWIYDVSFLLSFSATGGILFFYKPIAVKLAWLPRPVALSFAVTLAAELASLPFIAYYFAVFPVASFVANLVAVPLLEMVVLLGLLGSLFVWLLPSLYLFYRLLFVVCACLIGLSVFLVQKLALYCPPLYLPVFSFGAALFYYGGLFYLFGYHPAAIPAAKTLWRRGRLPVIVALLVISGVFSYAYWYPGPASVHFIDVGQGDATLVISSQGHAALIDTGGLVGENPHFDVGDKVVVPYLRHYGVRCLDYLMLTHGHADHAGGAAAVAAKIPVKKVVLAQEPPSLPVQALEKAVNYNQIIFAQEGQVFSFDDISIEVIHAKSGGRDEGKKENEHSVVYRINCGKVSFLITGDLEKEEEQALLEKPLAPVTVLKVGHHGSKNASSTDFLQALQPQYAIISVGYQNHFGHPHAETLARLQAQHIKIFRTDLQGAIHCLIDRDQVRIEPFIRSETK